MSFRKAREREDWEREKKHMEREKMLMEQSLKAKASQRFLSLPFGLGFGLGL